MVKEQVLHIIKSYWQRFSWGELFIFCTFVVFATLIWYAHAMSSVRSAIVPVAVTYSGVPENVLLSDSLPKTIHLELRDAGRRLKVYGTNPLSFSFNIGEQIKGEAGTFTLSSDVIHHAVNSLLQGTTKLQAIIPEQIVGSYTRQHSKKVPIRLVTDITPAAQYQLVGSPTLLTDKVTIFGSTKQLSTVDTVSTELLELKDLKDSVTTTIALTPIPNIRFAQNEVSVQVIAEQFTEKVFVKPISTKHVPEGKFLRLFPTEVTVMLRVGVAHFNDIDEQEVEITCDYPKTEMDKLPVHISCSNPFVTTMRTNPAAVEFLIEQKR